MEIHKGDIATLSQGKIVTWTGWALYVWDMGYTVILFKRKPKLDKDSGFDLREGLEGVCPYFLRACGVGVPFDQPGDEGFYYGEGCYHGEHPPIRIKLRLPQALVDQLQLP
jgi:hypothetical protein